MPTQLSSCSMAVSRDGRQAAAARARSYTACCAAALGECCWSRDQPSGIPAVERSDM